MRMPMAAKMLPPPSQMAALERVKATRMRIRRIRWLCMAPVRR